jgi:transcriptional regulator with XRE-family HTH domain
MNVTLGSMTLQEILRRHGITELRHFMERAGIPSRQQAWSLWHGEAGVGKVMAQRLHERLHIPIDELIRVDPVPYTKPRRTRYQAARGGHAPGHLRDGFLQWLEESLDLRPEAPLQPTVEINGEPRPISWLLGQLWNCTDTLPRHAYDSINDMLEREHLPPIDRQTYAAAVRALRPMFSSGEDPRDE